MTWVLPEIVIPLLLAAALGLALGWLLWRRRRRPVTVGEWEYEPAEVAPTHVGMTEPTTRLRGERDRALAHLAEVERKLQRTVLRLNNLEEELAAREQWSRQVEADFLRAKSRVAELETARDRQEN